MKEVQWTHVDKILFPKSKITKEKILLYYEKIAPLMLPLMQDRPVSMLRYPDGINGEGFYQKNVSEYFPKWIETVKIARKGEKDINMLLCNNKETLLYIANQGCLTPHLWLSRKDKLDYPDRLIFDFDPPSAKAFPKVMQAAKEMRSILEDVGLTPFVMTTGSRGLHIIVPIKREHPFEKVRAFAKKTAEFLVSKDPESYTTEVRLNKRKGRIFIDYLRNAYAQTAVAPYAVRAIEGAPVAAPLDWSEVKKELLPQKFTIENIVQRATKKNPWKNLEKSAKKLNLYEK
jgi:bifunctional non-homologous end joining protein LigD